MNSKINTNFQQKIEQLNIVKTFNVKQTENCHHFGMCHRLQQHDTNVNILKIPPEILHHHGSVEEESPHQPNKLRNLIHQLACLRNQKSLNSSL